ncbi:type II toxin-antitoxin system HicB family antitoxin [bacterium]|nr:type II toxin-antitoxin system HicB family antitoxin [bacterium]
MVEKEYTAIFELAEEGGYIVTIPALPGLVTEGDTLDEAKEMAKDAIRCHIASLIKRGLPIPEDIQESMPLRDKLAVAV